MLDWFEIVFIAMLATVAILVVTRLHKKSRIARVVIVVFSVLLLAAVIQSLFFSVTY